MVDDLMSSGRLDGLSRDQVIALLGPPHLKDFPGEAWQCDIHYFLGPERGFFRIDSEWLFITFDKDEKVRRYWIYRD
jgi:outer membrane protein assembly factor BamE (lipoprotein component of BamABCDE complex)